MESADLIMQGGFAGLSVMLIGAVAWIGRTYVASMKESQALLMQNAKEAQSTIIEIARQSNGVVRDNTEAISEMKDSQLRATEVSVKLHEELLKRPCMLPKN